MHHLDKSAGLNWHPQREFLFSELHSRPFQVIPSHASITHMALLADPEVKSGQGEAIKALVEALGYPQEVPEKPCVVLKAGDLTIRWEKHLEFASLTFTDLTQKTSDTPAFEQTALRHLPDGWLDSLPGTVVAAFHLRIEDAPETGLPGPSEVRHAFDDMRLVGSSPQQGGAQVWTSFQLHEGGFGRFLIYNRSLSNSQMGRMVQRLMEVETYRLMALLGLTDARGLAPVLARMDALLAELTSRLAEHEAGDEAEILATLTDMAAEIESHRAKTTFRFNASFAYHDILLARLEELREDEVSGHLTLREFLTRRLSPAVRSCRTMQVRLDDLSRRIDRASDMMRTRVELAIQNQNRELLGSMDRRSRIQLMMQHTVEGLSVAAISYYSVGLIKFITEALYSHGYEINKDLVTGVSVPLVIGTVWLITRRIHRKFHELAKAEREE